jgi:flagellar hook-length control protein FliK
MTTSTVQGAGVRASQPATGPRSASATSGDAFAAVLSRSESVQRRPADRPEPRPEPAQQRRLAPIQVRRSDLADRPAPIAQRDRHGSDLGVTRPRSVGSAAASSTRPDVAATSTGGPTTGRPGLPRRAPGLGRPRATAP